MAEGFSKRSLAMTAVILLLVVVGLQTGAYFRLTFVPANPGPPADADGTGAHGQYERDYQTLWHYIMGLTGVYVLMVLITWAIPKSRYNRAWRCRLDRLFLFECCILDTRFSLSEFLQVSGLIAINGLVIFSRDRVLFSESRDLYHQEYANRFAQLAVVNCSMAVALAVRYTTLPMVSFPSSIRWHAWFARLGGFCALYHACFQLSRNYARQDYSLLLTLFSSVRYTTGVLMIGSLCLLTFGSHPLLRTLSYRLFRLTHLVAFLTMVVVGFIHHWTFVVFYLAVAAMWLRDQYIQYVHTTPAKIVAFKALPANIVKIQLQPAFTVPQFLPGQFAYVSFEGGWLSNKLHAHPFSVSRFEREARHDTFTFYIRATGRQTAKLHHMVMAGERPATVRMSSPLGQPLMGNRWFGDFEVVIFVAEGIGITPWISAMQQLVVNPSPRVKTKNIIILWTMRDRETLDALKHELVYTQCTMKVFVTRQDVLDLEDNHVFISVGRPDYESLFRDIREEYPNVDIGLGVCAHNETIRTCGNIARRHNNAKSIWVVKNECFGL
ncbi:hypothetical protein BX666DRAFT_2032495 [Dichotomocladium elegans]|nr:hypothetical protein BX666DRAFT_2032495 [Dichotomocladium elegans]